MMSLVFAVRIRTGRAIAAAAISLGATVWSTATIAAAGFQTADRPKYAGRPVVEVLRALQDAGLRLIFSADLVPATLRVKSEPSSTDPRQVALDILTPHGLTLRDGPRGTLLVVAADRSAPARREPAREAEKTPARQPAPKPASGTQALQEPMRINEHVSVTESLIEGLGHAGVYAIDAATVRETAGGFENVFQVLPTLPGAAGTNDEDGKLTVRGAGPEHNGVMLDGVLVHNPYRFSELMSSFLNPATAARVALDASGLDAANGGRLSSITIIETRDGIRDRRLAVSASMGLASGDVLMEGRLPGSESGSWWATARGTYYRPLVGPFRSGVIPSFGDVQGKVTLRPKERMKLSLFGLAGREGMTRFELGENGQRSPSAEFEGRNTLAFAHLLWASGAGLASTTTASFSSHHARDFESITFAALAGGPIFDRSTGVRDVGVRQRVVFAVGPAHVVDAGVEVQGVRSTWRMSGVKPPIFWRGIGPGTTGELVEYPATGLIDSRLSRTQVGIWLQDRLPIGARFSVEPGVRVDWNSLTGESTVQPRIRATARIGGTFAWAGFAVQSQPPSHEALQGFDYFQLAQDAGAHLNAERSRQFVVGMQRALGAGFALRLEAYRRRFDRLLVQRLESDAERAARLSSLAIPPDLPPDTALLEHRPTVFPASDGRGTAAGVEVLVRREGRRIAGWLGYTLSRAVRDTYGYEFPFDFDRRHALNAVVNVALARRWRLSTTWLLASGFPITPLRDEAIFLNLPLPDGSYDPIARPARNRDGSLLMGPNPTMRRLSLRNGERLSGYSRADVRVTYSTLGRWEVYGEVINLFGTRNYLQHIQSTSAALGGPFSTENNVYENFERLPTFGVRVRF